MKNPKPAPVVVTTICSLCDQPWEAHGDTPTTEDCIRLLKAEIARRPTITISQPYPYPVYPVQPYRPYWTSGTICGTDTASGQATINASSTVLEFKRPDDPPGVGVIANTG